MTPASTHSPDTILHLRSGPETVAWGHIVADRPAALTIRSGDRVRIDTVSHQGLLTRDPAEHFVDLGISSRDVLDDASDIYRHLKREPGGGAHIITGPVYVEDARPGDMLEVRILDIEFRVPYGINASGPGSGALPNLLGQASVKLIRLDLTRQVAVLSQDIEVPLSPFMGIMAVAPPPERSPVSTKPPGPWGGNMDFRRLVKGSTLYLPVFNDGAQFYTGDGHAVQGDGEINGTAIEISLAPTLQFVLHKNAGHDLRWPRAEDATHFYVMGMAPDLDEALRLAAEETVSFLRMRTGLSPADAYALASIGVDFGIGEAVNNVKMVFGAIPKRALAGLA